MSYILLRDFAARAANSYASEYTGDYSELVYLRSRYYSSEMGRFLTKDSWKGKFERPLSLNQWMYTEANPVNFTDPLGLCVNCYVFFFPGLGNYGDANSNGKIDEIGVGEGNVVNAIEARTHAKVEVVYPYGVGLGGTLPPPVIYKMLGRSFEVDPRMLTVGRSAVGIGGTPYFKAQEIVARLLGGFIENCRESDYGTGQFDDSASITFVGYSGGGQMAYSTAQNLTGKLFVDNLVMFGSPFRAHNGQGNIGNIWSFVSEQDDVLWDKAILPTTAFDMANYYTGLYSGNATSCTLFGDSSKPYIHYDNGSTDYFGMNAKFTGQACFGEHTEQSVSRDYAAQLNISRFEANMTMLVGIIEGLVK